MFSLSCHSFDVALIWELLPTSDTFGLLKESLHGAPPPLHPTLNTSTLFYDILTSGSGGEGKGPPHPTSTLNMCT